MLYPPKKRAYSPELTKTKDLANLPNINSKFTGSGGSTHSLTQTRPPWPPRSRCPSPSQQSPAFSRLKSTIPLSQETTERAHPIPQVL